MLSAGERQEKFGVLPLDAKRDVDLTWGLYGAGKMMGIALVDHIIITENSHYSFADNGRLCNKE